MLCILESIDSTNTEVRRKSSIMPNFSAFFAKEQTDGKGRIGRKWESISDNVSVSFILKPNKDSFYLQPKKAGSLAFVSAVSIIKTIEPLITKNNISCKWPNDILVDNKKISGVLLESEIENDLIKYVIAGIGINVNSYPTLNSNNYQATSIFEYLNKRINPISVAERLETNLRYYLNILNQDGLPSILSVYRKYLYGIKKHLIVRLANIEIEGIFEEINSDGSIILNTKNGLKIINAGDIIVAK